MWLSYGAAYLEKKGNEILLLDAPAAGLDYDDVEGKAKEFGPAMLVVSTSTPSIYNDVEIADKLKKSLGGPFTVLVGPHVSARPEESLGFGQDVDAVARREFETILVDLAAALENGGDLSNVEGITYRSNGEIVSTPDAPMLEDLDEIPFVSKIYKRFLDISDYFNPNALYPMVALMTSRGCAYGCSFCVYPQTFSGRKLRYRSVSDVVSELQYIVEVFSDMKGIFFEDDTLTTNRQRCRELCQAIIDSGLKLKWTSNCRADMDLETLKLMKKAGCRTVCVGFESGSQEILDNIDKGVKAAEMKQFIDDARKAGILVHGCFIAGFPGDTPETMEETLKLAKHLNPDTAQFYPLMTYPGTSAYDWFVETGLLAAEKYTDWLTEEGLHNCVVRTEQLTARDIVEFCDRARKEFYLRPGYIVYKCKQMITRPSEIPRTMKAAQTFFKYLFRGSFKD
jgi:radical SAM superfamily enzyme YgiQ (UPF0313 family)